MSRTRWLIAMMICLFFYGVSQAQPAPEGFYWYKVKPGDTLSKIAPREHWEIIKRVNRIDERHLPAGKKILLFLSLEKAKEFVPVPEFMEDFKNVGQAIQVFLKIQYFAAYREGQLLFWGPISSGNADYPTLKGEFTALWKARNYFSRKYEMEMPYAVCFSNKGYFLHSQSLPGRPASHGCVRLLPEDAKKLFDWIKKGDLIVVE